MGKRIYAVVLLMVLAASQAWSQCAMCRSTLENNVSNGEAGIAAGVNAGILYLFAMPYLMVFIIGLLWYNKSRRANPKPNLVSTQKEKELH